MVGGADVFVGGGSVGVFEACGVPVGSNSVGVGVTANVGVSELEGVSD
jgi:hypothetical protein